MKRTIQGECRQLLAPEQVGDYSVGSTAAVFGRHGWYVAVVVDTEKKLTFEDRLRQLWPFTKPSNCYDVLVREPNFEEGDTVELDAEPVSAEWYAHPKNPLKAEVSA